MRIEDPMIVAALPELNVELRSPSALAGLTSLAIGGTTPLLRIKNHETIPSLLSLLESHRVLHRLPGRGAYLPAAEGALLYVCRHFASSYPAHAPEGHSP